MLTSHRYVSMYIPLSFQPTICLAFALQSTLYNAAELRRSSKVQGAIWGYTTYIKAHPGA